MLTIKQHRLPSHTSHVPPGSDGWLIDLHVAQGHSGPLSVHMCVCKKVYSQIRHLIASLL